MADSKLVLNFEDTTAEDYGQLTQYLNEKYGDEGIRYVGGAPRFLSEDIAFNVGVDAVTIISSQMVIEALKHKFLQNKNPETQKIEFKNCTFNFEVKEESDEE